MKDHAVAFLVDEVDELMGAGSVGLYEFFDILRGLEPALSEGDKLDVATQALQTLLQEPRNRLVWEVWARPDLSVPAQGISLATVDWSPPAEGGRYLTIEPN